MPHLGVTCRGFPYKPTAVDDGALGARREAAAIVADIQKLEADPALLIAVQRRAFIEKGLELVDGRNVRFATLHGIAKRGSART
jgi:hypothetical protein